ncbi:MAG: hypothetical protein N2738_05700 [Thermodesulfovibrionales bacterium]|nr:hypothetical protein [Thermodesulfovibrionales bacterium]
MLKSLIKEKPDGTKQYPPYFEGKIKDQEQTARQHTIKYWYLDEIEQSLRKELFIK